MNSKERNRLKAIIRIETGSLNQKTASEQLCISIRQLQRLNSNTEKKEQALVSKCRGKRSNHSLSDDSRKKIAEIIIKNYEDFGRA